MYRRKFAKKPRFWEDRYEVVLELDDQAVLLADLWHMQEILASLRQGKPLTPARVHLLEQVHLHLGLMWHCDDAFALAKVLYDAALEAAPLNGEERIDLTARKLLADLDLDLAFGDD